MIRHLLVPIDASEPAENAVGEAIDIGEQTGSRLTFCYAVDWEALVTEIAAAGTMNVEPLIAEERERGHEILARASARAAARGVPSESVLEDGGAVDVILRVERELQPDLVIMGTHGRRGLSRMILGSTTESVLHKSPIPVLVVPMPRRPRRAAAPPAATVPRATS
jgi:nucleotide-binding universal stress UspA family protein